MTRNSNTNSSAFIPIPIDSTAIIFVTTDCVGVHIYICVYGPKIFFESHFSDRLTFSNIRGRTSCRIYRLALPLHAPENFPRRVNQGFSYIMRTLLYLSGWMTQLPAQTQCHTKIG